MKRESLKEKTAENLKTMLIAEQAKLAQLRFDTADRKLKRTSDIPATRRKIARILTALRSLV